MAAFGAIAGTMALIALTEGIAAFMEHREGNPEEDVAAALQSLAAKNQRRAFSIQAGETLGQEEVERNFARFNEFPSRILTEAALSRTPQPPINRDTAVLDMVAARLGVSPQQLSQVSHPSRMGDMSQISRALGTSPGIN
jgi:hypothetical protein